MKHSRLSPLQSDTLQAIGRGMALISPRHFHPEKVRFCVHGKRKCSSNPSLLHGDLSDPRSTRCLVLVRFQSERVSTLASGASCKRRATTESSLGTECLGTDGVWRASPSYEGKVETKML